MDGWMVKYIPFRCGAVQRAWDGAYALLIRYDHTPGATRLSGTVKCYNPACGFGFIACVQLGN